MRHVDVSRKGHDSHTGIYIHQRNPSKLDQRHYGDGVDKLKNWGL